MDINDDALRALWQRQQPPSGHAAAMVRKVQRHRRLERLRRAIEMAVTVAGIALLMWPAADGRLSPGQWLLIPFFSVFLIVSWTVLLRPQADQRLAAHAPASVYVCIRKRQLRTRLRHLTLARAAATALIGYAWVSVIACWLVGTAAWQDAALRLAAWAIAWAIGTWWLVRRQGTAIRAEYLRIARFGAHD
ncbi:hypothetical protein KQ945_08560 [Bacillus subtilis subsp. subtilis]|nr:hypothetical protein [Bacillus subtilis subsp. subtilis]